MTLFTPKREDWKFALVAEPKVNGCPFVITLLLDHVDLFKRHYTFTVVADWSQFEAESDEYFNKTTGSWFSFWSRDFAQSEPSKRIDEPSGLYERVAEGSTQFESHLQSVEAIQNEIVRRMKHGAEFRTSHKEGGTTIKSSGRKFVSAQYGDYTGHETLSGEAEFLPYLRQFFDMDTKRSTYPDSPPELDAWRLILRLLYD